MRRGRSANLRLGVPHTRGASCYDRHGLSHLAKTGMQPPHPDSLSSRTQISNRHFIARLETSVPLTKQRPENLSNRNIWEGTRAFSSRLIQIQGCAQNTDGEMRQMRSVVVELNPANHAVFLQILRDLCFADSQMFGELGFQPAVRDRPALSRSFGRAASRSSRQIPKSHPQRLAGFHVIGRNLIRIGEQENTGSGGSRIRIIQLVQRTGHQPPQHGIEFRHPRSQCRIASASVRSPFGRQHGFR
jgi:hypothetical protein